MTYITPKKPNCGLGAGFQGNLSGGVIPDLPPFSRFYVDGTFVQGYYGREDITIGGITARNQRLAIVNYTYWQGDGQVSGLLGLGYPYLTSLDGSDQNQPPYDPVFTTMWKNKDIDPVFSIALSRNESKAESYLALGGLPPVEVDSTSWAKTPIHAMSAVPEWGFETEERGLYIIKPEAFVVGKTGGEAVKNTTQLPVLIDVGATMSVLPKGQSRGFVALMPLTNLLQRWPTSSMPPLTPRRSISARVEPSLRFVTPLPLPLESRLGVLPFT